MIEPKPTSLLELFEGHPERWTQFTSARNAEGDHAYINDPEACQWCLIGGVCLVYPSGIHQAEVILRLKSLGEIRLLSVWNDASDRTHEEVVELCRKAGV